MRTPTVMVATFVVAGSVARPIPAEAITILARCGPSKGQSFNFDERVVGAGQGALHPEGITDGRITVVVDDKERLDIITMEAAGIKSYHQKGFKLGVVGFASEGRTFLITAQDGSFVETFLFKLNKEGVGTVAWTSSKMNSQVTSVSHMVAPCGPQFVIK